MDTLQIKTGAKTYEIKDENGELLGSFTFVPSDTNLIPRYNKMIADFEELAEQEKDTLFSEETLERVQNQAIDLLSAFAGEDMRDSFFKKLGAFTLTEDGLYIVNIMQALATVIEKETSTRMKKIDKKVSKYLEGYKK